MSQRAVVLLAFLAVCWAKLGFENELMIKLQSYTAVKYYTKLHEGSKWSAQVDYEPDGTDKDVEFVSDPFTLDDPGLNDLCTALTQMQLWHDQLVQAIEAKMHNNPGQQTYSITPETKYNKIRHPMGWKFRPLNTPNHKFGTQPQITIGVPLGFIWRFFESLNVADFHNLVYANARGPARIWAVQQAAGWANYPNLTPKAKDFILILVDLQCGVQKIRECFLCCGSDNANNGATWTAFGWGNQCKASHTHFFESLKDSNGLGFMVRTNYGKILQSLAPADQNSWGGNATALQAIVEDIVTTVDPAQCLNAETWYKKGDTLNNPSMIRANGQFFPGNDYFVVDGYGPYWKKVTLASGSSGVQYYDPSFMANVQTPTLKYAITEGPTRREFYKEVYKGKNPLLTHFMGQSLIAMGKLDVIDRNPTTNRKEEVLIELRMIDKHLEDDAGRAYTDLARKIYSLFDFMKDFEAFCSDVNLNSMNLPPVFSYKAYVDYTNDCTRVAGGG